MGKPADLPKLPNSTFSKQEVTLTLKVLIHCEGCKRKVKRIIKCVDGVDSVNIEAENGKVTIVGSGVDAKAVLQSLQKAGKHAEVWQFGGGKQPTANQVASQLASNNNNSNNKPPNNNNNNNNKANIKLLEDMIPKGKGIEGNNTSINGGLSTNFGGKAKGAGDMLELAEFCPPLVPPSPKPTFPNGGFTPGGQFEKPSLSTNNVAILSKHVAPRPTIYHGETSYSSSLEEKYDAPDEDATHLFSDENANNCTIM